jgi:hypothetical protein
MRSLVFKPGLSVSAASLGNRGVITDARNQLDQLKAKKAAGVKWLLVHVLEVRDHRH